MNKQLFNLTAGLLAATALAGCAVRTAPQVLPPVAPDMVAARMTEVRNGCSFYRAVLTQADEVHFDGPVTASQAEIAEAAQQFMLRYTYATKFYDPATRKYDESAVKFVNPETKDRIQSLTVNGRAIAASPAPAALSSYAEHCDYLGNTALALAEETNIKIGLLFEYAIKGALYASRDAHSSYYTLEETRQLTEGSKGEYAGVGISIRMEGPAIQIAKVTPESPAARAGLRKGDYIVGINGADMRGKTTSDVTAVLRGAPGASAVVSIERAGQVLPDITITRAVIEIDAVEGRLVGEKGNIALLTINAFSEKSAADLSRTFRDLAAQAEAAGNPLIGGILDVRGNPGGSLQAVEAMADMNMEWTGEGDPPVLVATGKTADEGQVLVDEVEPGRVSRVPLKILQDSYSASASEILAGALQDDGNEVIGQPSFGKGSVQSVYMMSVTPQPRFVRGPDGNPVPHPDDMRAVALTTHAFFPGKSGLSNQNSGVIPDIRVVYNDVRDGEVANARREVSYGRVLQIAPEKTRAGQSPRYVCALNQDVAGRLPDATAGKLPESLVQTFDIFNEESRKWEEHRYFDADLACALARFDGGKSAYTVTAPAAPAAK